MIPFYCAPSVTMEQEQHCRVCEYHERCNFYTVLLKYIKNGWGKLTYDEVLTLMPMYDFDTAFAVDELCKKSRQFIKLSPHVPRVCDNMLS